MLEKASKNISGKINFDDTQFSNIDYYSISYERAIELEKTLGKAILDRLDKEFTKLDKEKSLKNSNNSSLE